jgi:metal-responsive CopG/Arc/MetJ family transcriptional regulator
MPSILVELDEITLRALDQIAPDAPQRSEFIGNALEEAIRWQEYARARASGRKGADTAIE